MAGEVLQILAKSSLSQTDWQNHDLYMSGSTVYIIVEMLNEVKTAFAFGILLSHRFLDGVWPVPPGTPFATPSARTPLPTS